tara:strand:- start:274 stop:414 length:141 start_codon:yes stop_codon:yes gene_type:complete
MEEIKKFFENVSPMNTTDWDFFSSKLKEEKFKKNSTLIRTGDVENH